MTNLKKDKLWKVDHPIVVLFSPKDIKKKDTKKSITTFLNLIETLETMPKGKLYNGDFKKYFDTNLKRNIWVLGYFGGGAVNIVDALSVAKDYAESTGVPLETVKIDEILSSRRFKGFKFVFSTEVQEKEKDAESSDNVYGWLRD